MLPPISISNTTTIGPKTLYKPYKYEHIICLKQNRIWAHIASSSRI